MRIIKPVAQTLNRMGGVEQDPYSNQRFGVEVLAAGNLSGGMVTEIDPADLEINQLVLAKNVNIRNDRVSRRDGLVLFGVAKPDSNGVLTIAEYTAVDGTKYLLRHTNSDIHFASSASWNLLAGTLSLGEKHRVAILGDRYFFTNAVDKIQEIDFTADSYGDLGNAGSYRFIAGWADRLWGAWETGVSENPIILAYSGNKNYEEWSPLVDFSAGNVPLTLGSSGLSDFITGGIHPLGEYLIVVRSRSIWAGIRNASASNPASFIEDVPGVGSDMPDAIVKAGDSLIIPDYRAGNIYTYSFPKKLVPIADNNRREIFQSISDPSQVFAVFDSSKLEYIMFIPAVDHVRAWKYNFRTKAWSYDEYANITAATDVDTTSFSLTFDELTGTFDSLSGTLDQLGLTSKQPPKLFFGHADGDISSYSSITTDLEAAFTTELSSKVHTLLTEDINVQLVEFTIIPRTVGVINLYYSKDDGESFTFIRDWIIGVDNLHKPLKIRRNRNWTCGRFQWKITTSSCMFEILHHNIIRSIGGDSV